jgi:glycosyltransferase involved in cell wall biosynthesis
MFGGDPGLMRNYSWVVPNARDEREWPQGDGSGDYALFMGRICDVKGCAQIADMIRVWEKSSPGDGLKFVFAGQGDFDRVASMVIKGIGLDAAKRRLEFEGHVKGAKRAELVGKARVMLCPTQYVEPGGGSCVEALLCGTPVLASGWGCFTEYVIHGVMGWQCRTMADWISGIRRAQLLSRRTIAEIARQRHSFEAAQPLYDRIFQQIDLRLRGVEDVSVDVP